MQTEYLKYLIDTDETNSIAAAARKSFISSQGARKALDVLEKNFGCKLVERSGRTTKLTEQGMAILQQAKEMLALEEEMRATINRSLRSSEKAETPEAVVYMAGAFDTFIFRPLSKGFKTEFRNIRFVNSDNSSVVENLTTAQEDAPSVKIGVLTLFSPLVEENALLISHLASFGYSVIPWFETYDELAVSLKSPLAKRSSITFEDISGMNLVASNTDIVSVAQKLLTPDTNCTLIADSGFEYSLVANNEAVCFAPALNRPYLDNANYTHVSIDNAYKVTEAFVAQPDAESMKYVSMLRRYINEFYREEKETFSPYVSILL